ncbi:MAG: hypothetical protein KDJ35_06205 [Alphaproteobacteria bacterium]|nr:hypothetical protein [Alphaproteobacteria bacterium]
MNMMTARKIITVLLVCLSLSLTGVQTHAAEGGGDYTKPMPSFELLPVAEFEAQTVLLVEEPKGNENLKFEIRYPKDWSVSNSVSEGNFSLAPRIFNEMARFYSPPRVTGPRSQMEIKAMKLDFALTAEQWLLQYLKAEGSTVEGFRVHSESRAEVMRVLLERGQSYAVRSVVEVNGANLVVAEYKLPIENWNDEKILQAQVMDSFKLLNKKDDLLVEEMKAFDFLDIAKLTYPSSWDIRFTPFRSVDVMEASLVNFPVQFKGDTSGNAAVDGKIDFKIVSAYAAESLEAEIKAYEAGLQERGLSYGEPVEIEDYIAVDEFFEFARFKAYKINDQNDRLSNYEIWTSLLSAGDYFYFVTLYTPSREEDYALWSRNTETFKLVMKMLKPTVDSIAAK